MILADDLGYGDLGCYGPDGHETPNIDRMAKGGMRFTDFYVASSVCSASRAALLTGRYPIRTGVTGVISADTKKALPPEERTLAEWLKTRDYATAIFGKWHLGNTPEVWPLKQGFNEWLGTIGSNDMGKGRPTLEQRRAGKAGVELVENERVIEIDPDQSQLVRRYTERAVDFIHRKKDGPFFLYIPHNMPHTPLFVSERFEGKSDRGIYGEVISEIDWSVGQILAAVESAAIEENTVILFTSDNGPWLIFGDHGGTAGILSGGKKQTLEGGMRVPLIARWKGAIPVQSVCHDLVTSLDFLPTLLSFAEISTAGGPELDGRDLSDLFTGERGDPAPTKPFYFFYERELRAVRSGRWKFQAAHFDAQSPDLDAIGYGGVRGEVTGVNRPRALFDLALDPSESHDLSKEHPETLSEMMEYYKQGLKLPGAKTPNPDKTK